MRIFSGTTGLIRSMNLPSRSRSTTCSAPDDHWDLLIAELLLSGELDRMALQLSWRFAAARADPADPLTAHPAEHAACQRPTTG